MEDSFKLNHYLMTLTDRKAFSLFLGCFAAGVIALVFDIGQLLILPGLVIGYSLVLFYSQHRFYILLATETRNSPYFLGFLFTLSCLIKIFLLFSYQHQADDGNIFGMLIPPIGAALSTTIFGLIGRHLIISFDPLEEEQQELWKSTASELKENAASYQQAQKRMIGLVDDFVKAHQEILEHEQLVSRKHIIALTETSTVLDKISKDYPERIKNFTSLFETISEGINEIMDHSVPRISEEITKANDVLKGFAKSTKTVQENQQTWCEGINNQIQTFDQVFSDRMRTFQEEIRQIDQLIESFIEVSKKRLTG